jgi:hypothetical protein
MYQSDLSIIMFVSIRCIPDWYIQYDWQTLFIHTQWLIDVIDTHNMIDTPDWYIHYDWYPWLIHILWLIYLIDTNTMIDNCMYQSGVSIIVYASTRWINHSVCINHSECITHSVCINHSGCFTQCMYQSIDAYFMIDTSDWYIHYDW